MYTRWVLPWITDWAMNNRAMNALRPRVVGAVSGRVLELGFGSGRNLPHYGPGTTRIYTVDPDEVGRRLAGPRIASSPIEVVDIGLDGARLSLEDASVDHVVCTWTLCTIPDVESALLEVKRVLVDGGSFRFVEHGRHPDDSVARWQDRLTPVWRPLAGGCHLNRAPVTLVEAAGLEMVEQEAFTLPGAGGVVGWMTVGVARKLASGGE